MNIPIHMLGFAVIAVLAVICLIWALASRKTYACPECGEKVRVEHMSTDRCGMCGAQLQQES